MIPAGRDMSEGSGGAGRFVVRVVGFGYEECGVGEWGLERGEGVDEVIWWGMALLSDAVILVWNGDLVDRGGVRGVR